MAKQGTIKSMLFSALAKTLETAQQNGFDEIKQLKSDLKEIDAEIKELQVKKELKTLRLQELTLARSAAKLQRNQVNPE
jgi:hypothetical protein